MPLIRPFLAVSQTTLHDPETGNRYPFNGLFAGQFLPKGSFPGFYNGDFKDGYFKGAVSTCSKCRICLLSWPKKINDIEFYILAMCNEPEPGSVANVTQHEFTKAKDVVPQLAKGIQNRSCFYKQAGHTGGARAMRHL